VLRRTREELPNSVDDTLRDGLREACYLLAGRIDTRRELHDAVERIAKLTTKGGNPDNWGWQYGLLAAALDGARTRNGEIWLS
jgi:hypothetical protein